MAKKKVKKKKKEVEKKPAAPAKQWDLEEMIKDIEQKGS